MIMFGETGWIKILAKAVWQIKRLLIVTTNLDGLRLEIADDLPNLPNYSSTKHSHYTVYN